MNNWFEFHLDDFVITRSDWPNVPLHWRYRQVGRKIFGKNCNAFYNSNKTNSKKTLHVYDVNEKRNYGLVPILSQQAVTTTDNLVVRFVFSNRKIT